MRAAANASTPMAPAPTPVAARRNKTRWPLIIGAILLILAALAALFALTRQADLSGMKDRSALPETPEAPVAAAAPAPLVTLAEEPPRLDAPVIDETAPRATTATPPPAKPDVAVPPTAVRLAPQGTPPEAAVAGTTYKLLIQPWGTIVVDGVERVLGGQCAAVRETDHMQRQRRRHAAAGFARRELGGGRPVFPLHAGEPGWHGAVARHADRHDDEAAVAVERGDMAQAVG